MKEITVTGYTLNELSPVAFNEAYSEWLNTDYSCAEDFDSVIEDMKECGAAIGIKIDRIFYSGFYHQGAGACFIGSYRYDPQWESNLKDFPTYQQLFEIGERLADIDFEYGNLSATVYKVNHRYEHETSVTVDVESDNEELDILAAQEALEEALRDFMREIYRRLQEEYEYSTSREAFKDMAEAYDWYFTAEGRLIEI